MVSIGVDFPSGDKEKKRRKPQVINRIYRPAILTVGVDIQTDTDNPIEWTEVTVAKRMTIRDGGSVKW